MPCTKSNRNCMLIPRKEKKISVQESKGTYAEIIVLDIPHGTLDGGLCRIRSSQAHLKKGADISTARARRSSRWSDSSLTASNGALLLSFKELLTGSRTAAGRNVLVSASSVGGKVGIVNGWIQRNWCSGAHVLVAVLVNHSVELIGFHLCLIQDFIVVRWTGSTLDGTVRAQIYLHVSTITNGE